MRKIISTGTYSTEKKIGKPALNLQHEYLALTQYKLMGRYRLSFLYFKKAYQLSMQWTILF